MSAKNKKAGPVSGAERTRKSYNKKIDAGLKQIKVWVDPVDETAVRNYAARKPATKSRLAKI